MSMAKIRDRDPKDSSGAYERLFGNAELGTLISKIQGTVISSGSELEKMIQERVQNIKDLDKFLEMELMQEGVYLATKKQVKNSTSFDCNGIEPDFLIFKRRKNKQKCYVIELKDGHAFDTKKAEKERDNLHRFTTANAPKIQYVFAIHIVSFNKDNRNEIVEGFKNKITIEEAMTGREFCELLEINYDEIVKTRQSDQKDNMKYFLEELSHIEEVKNFFIKKFNNCDCESIQFKS